MKSFLNLFKPAGMAFVVLSLLALGITGCTSGGSSFTGTTDEGELVISLTDAAGDFATYTVDVLSLNLEKANGAEVSTLPLSTRIDFAQYTEMTEFLTATTIPAGIYISATMTLDFQNADIWVENEDGVNVQVADIVDEDGNPVTTMEVSVQLEDRNRLTIVRGVPAHLMLDFDLQASNQVNFDNPNAPVLTVDPFLVADVNRSHQHKLHRIRGLLNDVDPGESSFSVILRPFYIALTQNHSQFGIRSVKTDDDTIFNIDGVTYEGQNGLIALNDLDPLSPVVAVGSLKFNPLRFEAWEVYAGSSVPGSSLDVVSGWVTERSDDTLTVKGATLIRTGSTFVFNDEVTLQVADTTIVKRQISGDSYTKEDISIGQHIMAFGTLTNTNPQSLEMDATAGFVRMLLTTIRGTVNSVDEEALVAQLSVNLQSIGRFRAGNYNFAGTGFDPDYDADPEDYEIYTGTMNLSGIAANTPIKLKGFVEPFGMAPPDFEAFTIIDVADLKAFLKIDWYPPSETPFSDISSEGLTVNLDGAGRLHYLVRGHVVTDLFELEAAPVIEPDGDGRGLYVLKYSGVTEIHTIFVNFVQRLEELLEEGYVGKKTNALGEFDDETSVLTVDALEIRLGVFELDN